MINAKIETCLTQGEMKNLHNVIIQVSKHKEIPRRYFWFEEILLENKNTRVIMSFDEIVQLGKKQGYPVTDEERCFVSTFFFKHSYYICSAFCRNKKWDIIVIHFCLLEFIGFLHTTNNITFYESSSFECKKRGQISTDLLNQVIQNSRIDQSKQLENSEIRTVEILEKFNIVCRVKKSNELKQSEMYD
jgi:hypothetical protein